MNSIPTEQATLLDSSVLSDFLRDAARDEVSSPCMTFIKKYLESHTSLAFSVVTWYEVRRGLLKAEMGQRLDHFDALCKASSVIPLDGGVVTSALGERTEYPRVWPVACDLWVELSRRGKPIGGDADILIAATAKLLGYAVVTRDHHFDRLRDHVAVIKLPGRET